MAIVKNKRAYFDYDILKKIEAGVVLRGYEVKSIKLGHISLKGSYISIHDNEAWLINAHISPYQTANMPKGYDPTNPRKLLLKRAEIAVLREQTKSQGLTILPLSVYTKKGKIKIEIGVGRGKKKYEKRELLKKKAEMKDIDRALKQR